MEKKRERRVTMKTGIKVRIVYSITKGETFNALGQDIEIPVTKIEAEYMDINRMPTTKEDFNRLESEIRSLNDGWNVYIISISKLKVKE